MLTKKLKLSALSEMMLKDKEMCSIMGGRFCTCSCAYANSGGSKSEDNKNANYDCGPGGYSSTSGCNQYYKSDTSGVYFPDPSDCDESTPLVP